MSIAMGAIAEKAIAEAIARVSSMARVPRRRRIKVLGDPALVPEAR